MALSGQLPASAAGELRQEKSVALFSDFSTCPMYRSAQVKAIESAPCFLEFPTLLRRPSVVRGPVLLVQGLCSACQKTLCFKKIYLLKF